MRLTKSKKIVLITGCSSGIGHALALEFKLRDFVVVATSINQAGMEDLLKQGITVLTLDVNDRDRVDEVVKSILQQFGSIDILINNAGYAQMGPTIEVPESAIIKQFQTNVFSGLYLIQQVAPSMKDAGGGLIVNIGSISGIATTPFSGPYCASKAAMHALSDALRMELSPFNIKVITVQPGGIESSLGSTATKKIQEVLDSESWYLPVSSYILERGTASQVNAMPVEEFAKKLVNRLIRRHVAPYIRIGKRSFSLPLMKKFIPVELLDTIMKRKFGLSKVESNT